MVRLCRPSKGCVICGETWWFLGVLGKAAFVVVTLGFGLFIMLAPAIMTVRGILGYETHETNRLRGSGVGDPHSPASAMGSVDRAPRNP